jgi:uncharacterized membrane protein YqjE
VTDVSGAPAGGGLLASLRRMGATAIDIAEVRLELLGTEAEVEKLRIARGLLLGALGFLLVGLAALLLVAFAVLILQEPYRLPAMAVLGGLLAAAGAWLLWRARALLRGPAAGMFALSRAELRRDRQAFMQREP